MKMANLTDVKNDLSRYVERVARGERLRILVRGLPVADLVPVGEGLLTRDEQWTKAELKDLARRGIIRPGKRTAAPELDRPGPRIKGRDAVGVLLEERRGSR